MLFYSGYYFCTSSHWDNKIFHCSNLVVIPNYYLEKEDKYSTEDFNNLVNIEKIFDQEKYDEMIKVNANYPKELCFKKLMKINQKIIEWLETNIKDSNEKFNGFKGWCIGDDKYNSNANEGFSIFFYRRADALKFIQTFSCYKKPTKTYSQKTYIQKKLNLDTNKLEIIKK